MVSFQYTPNLHIRIYFFTIIFYFPFQRAWRKPPNGNTSLLPAFLSKLTRLRHHPFVWYVVLVAKIRGYALFYLSLMSPSVMPAFALSSSVIIMGPCVMVAGCSIRLSTPPRETARGTSFMLCKDEHWKCSVVFIYLSFFLSQNNINE